MLSFPFEPFLHLPVIKLAIKTRNYQLNSKLWFVLNKFPQHDKYRPNIKVVSRFFKQHGFSRS
uniref:Uncharacterized protein n=1 Tax=Tetranychus urticae TaxID=32264 RepID=T1KZY4_TETUR